MPAGFWPIRERSHQNRLGRFARLVEFSAEIGPTVSPTMKQLSENTCLSEDPSLTTYFFLGVMAWGEGGYPDVCRRRWTPKT